MIWLGQYQFLEDHGIEVSYVTSPHDFRASVLRRCTSSYDPLLIQGGGNLGDVWTVEQGLREKIVSQFHDRRIIQLPQSIWFNDEKNQERARRIFHDHPDFTLMVRDERSLKTASEGLGLDAVLAPDMALCLRDLERPSPKFDGVVWLGRSDKERAAGDEAEPVDARIERIDWATAPNMPNWISAERLHRLDGKLDLDDWAMEIKKRLYLSIARKRLARGVEIVARGKSLVTERLHGHILALLLDFPHVVLDNSYGKTGAFHRAWTKDSLTTHFAASRSEAAKIALSLATTNPSSRSPHPIVVS